jgi:hypothetical protein
MSEPRTCPNCQAEIPADSPPGVCPYCALRAGFHSAEGTYPMPESPVQVRSAEEVSRHFPELEEFELIGPGGMGTVYRARQRELDRPVAVKILHSHLASDPSFADRFSRESRTLARLDHPNIVRVYDGGHRDGLYYLVMEMVEGVTLRQAIRSGHFEPEEALAMVPQICDALQYAHDNGVVHRDIKPENILLGHQGSLKVADFGLAKLVGAPGTRITLDQQVMGTPHYMAPEQIEHPGEVDHRADIFALGVVFYEMLTGELPVGRFPPPSDKVEIDVRLDRVVLRTLEKEPSRRYQHASELRSEVESLSSPGIAAGDVQLPPWPRSQGGPWDGPPPQPYEYRSRTRLWGIPLIHIAFGRNPAGCTMKIARGIIAIGDAAVGGIAIGAFAAGGIAIGAMSVGLVSLGGAALGLLLALGGMAVGTITIGAFSLGAVLARGAMPVSIFNLSDATAEQLLTGAGVGLALAVTAAFVAAVIAAIRANRQEDESSDPGGGHG